MLAALILTSAFLAVNKDPAWKSTLDQTYAITIDNEKRVLENEGLQNLILDCTKNKDFGPLFASGTFYFYSILSPTM